MSEEKEIQKKLLSVIELASLIKFNNCEAIIGVRETSEIEIREFPYYTKVGGVRGHKSKLELVRDISSIANSGGGYIVIGCETSQEAGIHSEFVSKIKPLNKDDINLASWNGVLSSMTFPRITLADIEHGYIDEKVLWLKIPSAKKLSKYPIMVSADQWEGKVSEGVKGAVYGIYFRDGAENVNISTERLHNLFNDTEMANVSALSAEIRELKSTVEEIRESNQNSKVPYSVLFSAENLNKHIEDTTSKIAQGSSGFFYMYFCPDDDVPNIVNYWETQGENTVYHLLKNPPQIRNLGFDLGVGSSELPQSEGGQWEITNGNRKIIRVSKDGCIFIAGSIEDFLAWGVKPEDIEASDMDILINGLAFTEFVHSACEFVELFRQQFLSQGPVKFDVDFGFKIYDPSIKVGLERPYLLEQQLGPLADNREWSLGGGDTVPEWLAGEIILEVYRAGFNYTGPPAYMTKNEKGYIINKDFYKKL